MKTITQIQQEYDDVLNINRNMLSDSELKKAQKRAALLRQCKIYLESNPTEYFIEKTKEELTRRIDWVESNFHNWLAGLPNQIKDGKNPNQLRSLYNSEMEITKLRNQRRAVTYLLNNERIAA